MDRIPVYSGPGFIRFHCMYDWKYFVILLQYTPSVSTIILSGRTYSSQNVRQIWESESQHSLSPTIWSDIMVMVGRESGYLKIFFTFLEVNMSNILWSIRICKRTFFPVCRMSGYVNGNSRKYPSVFLPCTIFAPGRVAQRSIYNWNIVEKWRLNTHSLI